MTSYKTTITNKNMKDQNIVVSFEKGKAIIENDNLNIVFMEHHKGLGELNDKVFIHAFNQTTSWLIAEITPLGVNYNEWQFDVIKLEIKIEKQEQKRLKCFVNEKHVDEFTRLDNINYLRENILISKNGNEIILYHIESWDGTVMQNVAIVSKGELWVNEKVANKWNIVFKEEN